MRALLQESPLIRRYAPPSPQGVKALCAEERFYTFLPLSLDFFVPACYNQRSFILSKTLMRTN